MGKKKLSEHKDKTLLQAIKDIKNPFSLLAFLFFFKTKEMLLILVIILIVILVRPQILSTIDSLVKWIVK